MRPTGRPRGFGAIGGNTYQKVTQAHNYATQASTTTTTTQQLVLDDLASDDASILAGAVFNSTPLGAAASGFVLGRPIAAGTGGERGAAGANFGNAAGAANANGEFFPDPNYLNPGFSPQGRFSAMGLKINPGDLVVPVYALHVGAAKSVLRASGAANYASQGGFQAPANWVIAGYRVYRAGSTAIGNEAAVPGQQAASVTNSTFEQKLTVTDLSAGDSANAITVADASVVEAGAGNDTILIGSGGEFCGRAGLEAVHRHRSVGYRSAFV